MNELDEKFKIVENFLNGHDPMKYIVNIDHEYQDDFVKIVYYNDEGQKRIKKDDFKPFVWVKQSAIDRMCDGNHISLSKMMAEYGIGIKALKISDKPINLQEVDERLINGYKYIMYAKRAMSQGAFNKFFNAVGTPLYSKNSETQSREFLSVNAIEQYMISTGRRMFKGYDAYNATKRLIFDLETQGLHPEIHGIDQIGIRTNKGFETILSVEGEGEDRKKSELNAICGFFFIIGQEKPDIIVGYNSEKFDFEFINTRCKVLGCTMEALSESYMKYVCKKEKREIPLKLGGETEFYHPTTIKMHTVIDGLHSVRRAQALDSSMKMATLKYVTKYLKIAKANRVYVPGNEIKTIWRITDNVYAFDDTNGKWRKLATENDSLTETEEKKSGRYIVERYLLDDLWETDKVEATLNEANFLVNKILPTTFQRACTMGTAAIWKLITLAWAYENNLVVPAYGEKTKFTGGLSRLLRTGFADRIVKLDYNSLYPSIMLTWNIQNNLDTMNIMLLLLDYVLTQREYYKGLKSKYGKEAEKYKEQAKTLYDKQEIDKLLQLASEFSAKKSAADKNQLPLKILGNSMFGSFGAPHLFPFGNIKSAEMVTCIGRQCLRLMIYHFSTLGDRHNLPKEYNYIPIVGDTDGFNFQMPLKFRYNEENPYISNGGGRNSVKDKKYVGVEADVCEFEDLYFSEAWNGGINKMGLGIDEFCPATINFSRKNYADLLEDGSVKLVGNTVKSRRLNTYIEKFLDKGIDFLLKGKGQEFLNLYYEYVNNIYNYKIPIKDIATKGKIKKTMEDYLADMKTFTKSGSKKSRQAQYELALKNNMKVNLDDTIYYVNCGTKSKDSDVKRETIYYGLDIDGKTEVVYDSKQRTKRVKYECEKKGLIAKGMKDKEKKEICEPFYTRSEDIITLNCDIVPQWIIDSEEDVYCVDKDGKNVVGFVYNVPKYLEMFNKRITPLLACFSPEIRGRILVDNPKDMPYFTQEECQLVSGYPLKETDQDEYSVLMTPEMKEIKYWLSINQKPPFVEECNMDWDKLVEAYYEDEKLKETQLYQSLNDAYLKALSKLTTENVNDFYEDGKIPSSITKLVTLNTHDNKLYFIEMPTANPSTGGDIIEDISYETIEYYKNKNLDSDDIIG